MHWPVTLLRWAFGPQPPNANAGVTVDDRAANRTATVAAAQNPDKPATRTTFMTIPPTMRVWDHGLSALVARADEMVLAIALQSAAW
jgi:hypothetical protein